MTMTHSLFAPHALLTTGWADNVLLQWDERGRLIQVQAHSTPDTHHGFRHTDDQHLALDNRSGSDPRDGQCGLRR